MNDLVSEYQQYQDATAAKRVSSTRRKVSTTWSRRRPNRQSRSRLDSSSFSAEFKHVRGRRPAILAFSRGSWVDDLPCNSNPCALERGSACCFSTIEERRGCWKSGFETPSSPAFVNFCKLSRWAVPSLLFFLTSARSTRIR